MSARVVTFTMVMGLFTVPPYRARPVNSGRAQHVMKAGLLLNGGESGMRTKLTKLPIASVTGHGLGPLELATRPSFRNLIEQTYRS